MGKHFKVFSSTKWILRENVVLRLMECLVLVLIYLWITISHFLVCLPTMELTTFAQHVCSTKIGYANALSLGKHRCKKKERGHFAGFPNWGRLVGGDNLDKMAKNCMKMTKSAFLGHNSGGHGGGGKPIFRVVGGIPPVPPTRGNPALNSTHQAKKQCNFDSGWLE